MSLRARSQALFAEALKSIPGGVIEEIHHLEKNDTNSVVAASDNIQYVLEVKAGWFARHNISPGTVIRTEKGSLRETFFSKPLFHFRRNNQYKRRTRDNVNKRATLDSCWFCLPTFQRLPVI